MKVFVCPPMRFRIVTFVVIVLLLILPIAAQNDRLPASLSDREFWLLTGQISESDGFFRSNSGSPDNLLSNEVQLSTVAAQLSTRVKPSGVYLGVGPEQNFTYIAAIRPRIAFITDIRRGNLQLHLVYKALFEMTSNRNEFISLLFTRKRSTGLTPTSSARALMNAYLSAEPGGEAAFRTNLKAITEHLTKTRSLPLDAGDLAGVEYVYRNFYRFGPDIHYTSSVGGTSGTHYSDIVSALDTATRTERSYLANEANFAYVKGMEQKNLIIPIVGDFAGPKALRGIGSYVRERGAIVSAFYVSNVEMYLQNNGVWNKFCANVATMPLEASSIFIRPGGGGITFGDLSPMAADTARCPK